MLSVSDLESDPGVCPCAVSPEQLQGQGPIVALAVHEGGVKPREAILLLVVHEESGAAVWDARCFCFGSLPKSVPNSNL